jgi:hypothetical protein
MDSGRGLGPPPRRGSPGKVPPQRFFFFLPRVPSQDGILRGGALLIRSGRRRRAGWAPGGRGPTGRSRYAAATLWGRGLLWLVTRGNYCIDKQNEVSGVLWRDLKSGPMSSFAIESTSLNVISTATAHRSGIWILNPTRRCHCSVAMILACIRDLSGYQPEVTVLPVIRHGATVNAPTVERFFEIVRAVTAV